jgi:hypothetical protein
MAKGDKLVRRPEMASGFLLRLHPDLKEAIGRKADEMAIPMNDLMASLLAQGIERPELAQVPKQKVGRKRVKRRMLQSS